MRRLGLGARITALFTAGALVLSASLAFATYELARRELTGERERTAVRAAVFDATAVRSQLAVRSANPVEVLGNLDTGSSRTPLVLRGNDFFTRKADTGFTAAVPATLRALAERGTAGVQRVQVADQGPAVAVAVPLPDAGATYYEINSLADLQRQLNSLGAILALAALGTALAGAGLGYWAGRRVLQPLASVAAAATTIAAGDLSTRLDPAREPDLARLSTSFNRMVDELAARMERDRRFTADVSHELRSPLQTLSAAASVLGRSRERLDERTAAAVDLVTVEVDRFSQLVTDLLDLARGDRPAERGAVELRQLAAQACARTGVPLEDGPDVVCEIDRRRVYQLLVNLLENAQRYGGGATAVRVAREGRRVVLEVDDEGPGVAEEERDRIFERFHRGRAASVRADTDGTGLGLALVAQHVAVHDGAVRVLDRPGGGARFHVELIG